MAVTVQSIKKLSALLWRIEYSSDLVSPTFQIYKNGVLLSTTPNTVIDIPVEPNASPVISFTDDPADVPKRFPERFQLFWQKSEGADSYRIERDTGAGYNLVTTIQSSGLMYYSYLTSVLEDGIIHNFRVVPVQSGNLGTPTVFSATMVKIPAVPDVSYSYDSGTGQVTITQN